MYMKEKIILNHQIQKHKCPHIWSLVFSLYIFHCAQYCKLTFTKAFFSQWNIRLCPQLVHHCVDHHLQCYTKGIHSKLRSILRFMTNTTASADSRGLWRYAAIANCVFISFLCFTFYIFLYVSSGFHFFICIHFLCCDDSCLENWVTHVSTKERKNKRGMGGKSTIWTVVFEAGKKSLLRTRREY